MPNLRSAFDICVHGALKNEIVAVSSGLSQLNLLTKFLCESFEEFENLFLVPLRSPRLNELACESDE